MLFVLQYVIKNIPKYLYYIICHNLGNYIGIKKIQVDTRNFSLFLYLYLFFNVFQRYLSINAFIR